MPSIPYSKCRQCGLNRTTVCECEREDSTCPNNHQWYKCENGIRHEGEYDEEIPCPCHLNDKVKMNKTKSKNFDVNQLDLTSDESDDKYNQKHHHYDNHNDYDSSESEQNSKKPKKNVTRKDNINVINSKYDKKIRENSKSSKPVKSSKAVEKSRKPKQKDAYTLEFEKAVKDQVRAQIKAQLKDQYKKEKVSDRLDDERRRSGLKPKSGSKSGSKSGKHSKKSH